MEEQIAQSAPPGNLADIAKQVKQKFNAARRARAPYEGQWSQNRKAYLGKLWDPKRPTWKASPTTNFIYTAIENILPIMTDSAPIVTIQAKSPESRPLADMLEAVVADLWQEMKMPKHLPLWCKNFLIYGSAIMKVYWDPEADFGLGGIRADVIDNFHFYPDPDASSVQDARYVITAVPTSVDEVKARFPHVAHLIKGEESVSGHRYSTDTKLAEDSRWHPGSEMRLDSPSERGSSADSERVNLIECWWKDHTVEPQPDLEAMSAALGGIDDATMQQQMGHGLVEHFQANGMEIPTRMMPKYPTGRVTVIAGDVVIDDKPNPYQHGQFPFAKIDEHIFAGDFWGRSTIEFLISPQMEYDKRTAQIIDCMNLTANPVWIVDKNAGVATNALVNRAGLIIRKNPDTEVRREPGPNIPPYVFRSLEETKANIDIISGVHDVSQGRRPSGMTTATGIAELMEAAQTRIRPRIRQMEFGINEMGEMIVSMIRQLYQYERVVPVLGPTKSQEWMYYDPMMAQDPSLVLEVRIEAGSTMPVSRVTRSADAQGLFQMGAIDRQSLLEEMDWPARDTVLQRMYEQEMQMMQQEQAPPGMQGPEEFSDQG
jgi:hypothetical protein